jgi:pimeloyl-ACP methyl ester carboxylesterase
MVRPVSASPVFREIIQPIALSKEVAKPSLCERIATAYANGIRKFVAFLWRHKWIRTAMILGTLLLEPWQALKAAFRNMANWKKEFNFHGMNPKAISPELKNRRPILLIHGNYHNQSAWLSLGKALKGEKLGPVYTVNLPSGLITEKDYAIVDEKIRQIKAQYKTVGVESIKVDLVGHSRGGFIAHRMAWTTRESQGKRVWSVREEIGKVIKIGSVTDEEERTHMKREDPHFANRLFEVTGKYEVLHDAPSLCPDTHKKEVRAGHLGLLYAPDTHRQVADYLR